MYPSEWKGSVESKKGLAIFKVDGKTFQFQLESFADQQTISDMLEAVFDQGKHFAATAMQSHIERAIEAAKVAHAL